MPSLKEIKGRIASVSGTLKITSAMKLVASAKLHKAQQAIGNMLPYERQLQGILAHLLAMTERPYAASSQKLMGNAHQWHTVALAPAVNAQQADHSSQETVGNAHRSQPAALSGQETSTVAVVAFSSNSALCGGFNANVIRRTREVIAEWEKKGATVTVFSVGRKVADAMRRSGHPSPEDYTALSEHPSYEGAARLADFLSLAFRVGEFERIILVYNHFQSTGSQPTREEVFLPFSMEETHDEADRDYILEPSAEELLSDLLPRFLRLRLYTVLLDAAAAEHAARTVAMQTATDNGNNLLQELTLEYNKSRQQKITSEILDLVGGSFQE